MVCGMMRADTSVWDGDELNMIICFIIWYSLVGRSGETNTKILSSAMHAPLCVTTLNTMSGLGHEVHLHPHSPHIFLVLCLDFQLHLCWSTHNDRF